MAVGGRAVSAQSSTKVDLISENATRPVPDCRKSPANFPQSVQSPMGAAIGAGQVPHVCGGYTSESGAIDQCYRYDAQTDYWFRAGKMSTSRHGAAHVNHPTRGLIMLGGRGGANNRELVSVESTADGVNFDTNYPEMLETSNSGACAALIDENRLIFSGGSSTPQRMQLLDLRTLRWTRLPNAPLYMINHGCGVTRNETGPVSFMMAGGLRGSTYYNIIYEYNLDTKTWGSVRKHPLTLRKASFSSAINFSAFQRRSTSPRRRRSWRRRPSETASSWLAVSAPTTFTATPPTATTPRQRSG